MKTRGFAVRMGRLLLWIILFIGLFAAYPTAGAQTTAGVLHEVCRMGRGHPQGVALRPDGKQIAVDTPVGTWLYTDTFADVALLERVRLPAYGPVSGSLAGVLDETQVVRWDGERFEQYVVVGRHRSPIVQLEWSADERYLASVDASGFLVVWDVAAGTTYLASQEAPNSQMAFLWRPEGNRVAILRRDTSVRVRDLLPSAVPVEIPADSGYHEGARLVWNPNGEQFTRQIYAGEDGVHIQVISVDTGEVNFSRAHRLLFNVAFSADGRQMALVAEGIELYDVVNGQFVRRPYALDSIPFRLSWSHDGRYLAAYQTDLYTSGVKNAVVQVWDTFAGKLLHEFRARATVRLHSITWSANDTHILTRSWDGFVRLWDVKNETHTFLDKHTLGGRLTAWSPDSDQIAIADTLNRVQIRNPQTCALETMLPGHVYEIFLMAWQPRAHHTLATFSNTDDNVDNAIRIWDTHTGQSIATLRGQALITGFAWSPNGRWLASSSIDGTLHIRSSHTWESVFVVVPVPGIRPSYPAYLIGFSPDSSKVLSWVMSGPLLLTEIGSGTTIRTAHGRDSDYLWAADSRRIYRIGGRHYVGNGGGIVEPDFGLPIGVLFGPVEDQSIVLEGHQGPITSLNWNHDRSLLATTSQDRTVRVWDIATGQTIHVFMSGAFAAWSPVDSALAVVDNTRLWLWNAATGQVTFLLEGGKSALWSPDGTKLVAFQDSAPPVVFNAANGAVMGTLYPNSAYIVWSPDSQKLLQLFGGTVIVWGW